MLARSSLGGCLTALLLVLPVFMFSQSTGQKHTLIINGQSTDVPLIHVNGHAYVGLEALAAALKGSLSSSGKMIALSIPVDSAKSVSAERATTSSPASTNVSAPMASSNPGFSENF